MRYTQRIRFGVVVVLLSLVLGGCGVAKLWGGADSSAASNKTMTLREQAVQVSEPLWEDPEASSFFGRIAGVLISGEESADTATAAFGSSGSEDEDVRLAAHYLGSKVEGEEERSFTEIAQDVVADMLLKHGQAASLVSAAETSLAGHRQARDRATGGGEIGDLTAIRKAADSDRRAVNKAALGLKTQIDVFKAARTLLAEEDENLDLLQYDSAYSKLDADAILLEDILSELQGIANAPTVISP